MKRDIRKVIASLDSESQDVHHRYYSFDFCYSHFRLSKENGEFDVEKSCQVLWSYLASWGMLRGSSFLLQKNPAYLKDLVNWIYAQPLDIWKIDVEHYNSKKKEILSLYANAKKHLLKNEKHQATTLVTKVLLGVFAIIPAYDRFFKETFSDIAGKDCGFSIPNEKSLDIISKFYKENKEDIDQLSKERKVFDFDGNETKYYYSKAKLIDMYGFQFGRSKAKSLIP